MKKYNVFDVQNQYPTKKQRLEFVKELSKAEIDDLISTCGTVQGKIYWSNLWKSGQIIKKTGIKKITFNETTVVLCPDFHREKGHIEVILDGVESTAKLVTYIYEYNLKKPVRKEVASVSLNKVEEAFHLINTMLPAINDHVMWIDDSLTYMTVIYEDGRKVKVDRGELVDEESIVYNVMNVLGL